MVRLYVNKYSTITSINPTESLRASGEIGIHVRLKI